MAGIGALLLFQTVAKRILSGWAVPFAIGLFSLGIPFIYFASQVKQYSTDIAAALLLLLFALEACGGDVTRRRGRFLAIAGGAAVWVSLTALFVVLGIAAGYAVLCQRAGTAAPTRAKLVLTVWVVSAVCSAFFAMTTVSDADNQYFEAFWRGGFLPFPPTSMHDVRWLPDKLIWVFGGFATGLGHTHGGLNYRWSPVFAALMLYGFWALWRSHRAAAMFLGFPALAAISAAAAGLYPFAARLLAFLIPFLLLAVAAGARHALTTLPRRLQFVTPAALAILGGAPLYAIATALPPSRVQHLRPLVEHLRAHRQASDRIYVYPGAAMAFRYYAGRLNLPLQDVVFGTCAIGTPRVYLKELDGLRGGARIWIVLTHEMRLGERALIVNYLDHVGQQLEALEQPGTSRRPMEGAWLYLYDLAATRNVDAATFPLPPALKPPADGLLRWGCYGIVGGEPQR